MRAPTRARLSWRKEMHCLNPLHITVSGCEADASQRHLSHSYYLRDKFSYLRGKSFYLRDKINRLWGRYRFSIPIAQRVFLPLHRRLFYGRYTNEHLFQFQGIPLRFLSTTWAVAAFSFLLKVVFTSKMLRNSFRNNKKLWTENTWYPVPKRLLFIPKVSLLTVVLQ